MKVMSLEFYRNTKIEASRFNEELLFVFQDD